MILIIIDLYNILISDLCDLFVIKFELMTIKYMIVKCLKIFELLNKCIY